MKSSRAFSLIELSITLVIIAILIAGVLEASNLVRQMRLSAARSLSRSSDVNSISNMVLWLDATAEDSLTEATNSTTKVNDTDPISAWADQNFQSPKLSFTQATTGKQPLYEEDGINSLPTLVFDTDADATPGYSLSKSYEAILNQPEFTIFVALKPIQQSTTNTGMFISDFTGNTGFKFYKSADTNNQITLDAANGTSFLTSVDSASVTFNTPYIVTARRTTTINSVYKNGTRVDTDTDSAVFSPSTGTFFIGCQADGATNCFDGYISEIIMYGRALKIEERRAVESYLGKKYAISVNFVTGQ